MKTIVLVTGGFDPIHSGHIAYINEAKKLGDILIVGANSDGWLARKKGVHFMPSSERTEILQNLKAVDGVILFNDDDGSSKEAIKNVRQLYPDDHIIFANGGDRTDLNIPEMDIEDQNLEFAFGIGGTNKANSSSWILQEWKAPKTERQWGYYRVLHEAEGMKVKELTVMPGRALSMQRHRLRAEYWIVEEGRAVINRMLEDGTILNYARDPHEEYQVPVLEWHQLTNPYHVPLKVVEIQYGLACEEDDIERITTLQG